MKYFCAKWLFISGFLFFSISLFAQKNHNALNLFAKFSDDASLNAHYEFSIAKSITLSPSIAFPFDLDWLALGGRADLYIDSLFNIPNKWDIWIGADTSFIISGEDSFILNAHAGVEYKLTNFIGLIGEIGGGTTSFGGIGLGFHF